MNITIKAKATNWQGRIVYRAYYLDNGTWRRFGKYEAGSEQILRQIIDRSEHSATLTWR